MVLSSAVILLGVTLPVATTPYTQPQYSAYYKQGGLGGLKVTKCGWRRPNQFCLLDPKQGIDLQPYSIIGG